MPYGYSPIPPGAVGTAQIIDESIQPADIDLDEDFDFGGDVDVGGDLTAHAVAPTTLVAPLDTASPEAVKGSLRINTCNDALEYYNGAAWVSVV